MDGLLPAPVVLRTRQWWVLAGVVAVVALVATYASYAVTLTDLAISPLLLPPAVAAVLLMRWGRSLWPGLAVGDLAGQLLRHDRALWLLLATVVLHTLVAVIAATWMRAARVHEGDLGAVLRYTRIVAVLSVGAGAVMTALLVLHDSMPIGDGWATMLGWTTLADVSGFLVVGGLLLAWLEFPAAASRRALSPLALPGVVVVAALAIPGFGWGVGPLVPVALLAALAVAARGGGRWGTLAMTIIVGSAVLGATRGLAPFGGNGEAAQAANAMWAISLFALGALMLSGYRHSDEGVRRPAGAVAMLFGIFMVVTGISSVAVNELAVTHDTPFVNSGLLALGAGLGLVMLRIARTPPTPTTRPGFVLAAIAGALYVANLALFLWAVPMIGSAGTTALSMTAPLAVVVLAVVVERVWPTRGVIAAVLLIVAGAIAYASGMVWNTAGVVLALASAWAFAASIIFTNRAIPRSNVTDAALISSFAAAAVALPIGLASEGTSAFHFTAAQVGAVALGALGANLVPLLSRAWALSQIGSSPVGAIGVLGPVVTIALSVWLLANPVDGIEVLGLVLIVGGAVIAALAGARGRTGTDDGALDDLEPAAVPST